MASASLRSSLRTAVAVGAFGALAVFGTAATAGAQPGPIQGADFGSLGSMTDLFLPGAAGNVGGSLAENLGSIAGMEGSATGSLDTASVTNMRETLVLGSSEGSVGSVGDLAGQVDPSGIDGSVGGSADGSAEGSTMVGGVDAGSVTGMLESASLGLESIPEP